MRQEQRDGHITCHTLERTASHPTGAARCSLGPAWCVVRTLAGGVTAVRRKAENSSTAPRSRCLPACRTARAARTMGQSVHFACRPLGVLRSCWLTFLLMAPHHPHGMTSTSIAIGRLLKTMRTGNGLLSSGLPHRVRPKQGTSRWQPDQIPDFMFKRIADFISAESAKTRAKHRGLGSYRLPH